MDNVQFLLKNLSGITRIRFNIVCPRFHGNRIYFQSLEMEKMSKIIMHYA